MRKMEKDVKQVVSKIVNGGAEVASFDFLKSIWELLPKEFDMKPEDYFEEQYFKKLKSFFGNSVFQNPEQYFKMLILEFRRELCKEHSLLETYRIFTTLQDTLECKIVRISKKAPNYKNVKIVRSFYKFVNKTDAWVTDLFGPLSLLEK